MTDEITISDADLIQAMQEIGGYVDISLQTFRKLYLLALNHARERLLHTTLIGEIMTRDVLTVREDALLEEVIDTMARRSISGLPVVDETKRITGVISEKDIKVALTENKEESIWKILLKLGQKDQMIADSFLKFSAREIMSTPAVIVTEENSVQDVLTLFRKERINRLPVVNDNGVLVGIVTRTDILHAHFGIDDKE